MAGTHIRLNGPREATIVSDDGGEAADIVGVDATDEEFAALIHKIRQVLGDGPPTRVLVTYQEGLLGPVHADVPTEVILIEDDAEATDPLLIRRRKVTADQAAVSAALAVAERKASVPR